MVWFPVIIVPPLLIMLFAIAMSGVWMFDRRRGYMLLFGASFAAFSLGLLVQVLQLLPDLNERLFAAAALQLVAGLFFCEAVMVRLGGRFPASIMAAVSIVTLAAIVFLAWHGAFYSYLIVAANVGLGSLTAILCRQVRRTSGSGRVDPVLRWVLIFLAAQFFVRSAFTVVLLDEAASSGHMLTSQYWALVTVAVSIGGALLGLFILAVAAIDIIDKLRDERDADPLTGVANRRGLERRARWKLAAASNKATHAVIIADIDHFKAINDRLGHAVGDEVLVEFSRLLQSVAGTDTVLGRIGGEEFVLLVAGSAAECERFGNRLCNQVARHRFPMLPHGNRMTCSFGIAMIRPGETLWDTVSRADHALLRGKHRGRNRTATEGYEFPDAVEDDYRLTA